MTPDEAWDIYYFARAAKTREFIEAREPVNESACRDAGMQAVIDEVEKRAK